MFDVVALNERVKSESQALSRLTEEVGRVIVGQKYMVERLMISLLADGHVLLEGVPGLAKTTAIKTLAQAVDTGFARVQFTPDLLPADLVGTQVYNPREASFSIKQGPLFTNFLLADEINRAPAKVQSALLEAMQERHVTIGGQTFRLPEPFLVLATQNPIEQEGTYPLPEAQVDRFMLKLNVGYPSREEELDILERQTGTPPAPIQPVINAEQILRMRQVVRDIYMDEKIKKYIVDIVFASREPEAYGLDVKPLVAFGASPLATIYLAQAARAHAALRGRGYVTPEDVKGIGLDVLRHRIIVTYEAEAEEVTPEDLARRLLDKVEVP
jgi:MoxR-like ATPase